VGVVVMLAVTPLVGKIPACLRAVAGV
jgi:hypothetical protein